jgi:hypothetical protein
MTDDRCEAYRRDPAADPAHLETCAACAAMLDDLEPLAGRLRESIDAPPVAERLARELPLAPWEGGRFRSWRLVGVVAAVLLAVSLLLFVFVGISPLDRISTAAADAAAAARALPTAAVAIAKLLAHAPANFKILLAVAFAAVTLLLIALLRRSPRGFDERT